jgi:hypothetical protein
MRQNLELKSPPAPHRSPCPSHLPLLSRLGLRAAPLRRRLDHKFWFWRIQLGCSRVEPPTTNTEGWKCGTCDLMNPASAKEKCTVCDAPKPGASSSRLRFRESLLHAYSTFRTTPVRCVQLDLVDLHHIIGFSFGAPKLAGVRVQPEFHWIRSGAFDKYGHNVRQWNRGRVQLGCGWAEATFRKWRVEVQDLRL